MTFSAMVTIGPRARRADRAARWAAAGFATVALLGVAACGSDSDKGAKSSSTSVTAATLEGTPWQLLATTPLGVDLGTVAVTAKFEGGTVSGSSGCNTYNGPYQVDGSKLTIGPQLASTQMACGDAQTAVEKVYQERLVKTASYKIAGTNLTLSDGGGAALLTFEAQAGGTAALEGSWNVTSYYTGNAVTSVLGGVELTAAFTADAVSGSSGCNTYRGGVTASGSTIKIGPLASTQKACSSQEITTQEAQFLAAMELATSFSVTGDRLDLLRDGGTIAVTLQRA